MNACICVIRTAAITPNAVIVNASSELQREHLEDHQRE